MLVECCQSCADSVHVNAIALRRGRLVLGWVDHSQVRVTFVSFWCLIKHRIRLSLAIPRGWAERVPVKAWK